MPTFKLPEVDKCCGCVTDLKTAAAIIAVLGIVTSPSVAWAVVRHSYVIRMSCFISTSSSGGDVVDINVNNIISFGFGANAGLTPTCLSSKNSTQMLKYILRMTSMEPAASTFIIIVRYLGWIVFAADVLFVLTSVRFLINIFKGPDEKAGKHFIYAAILTLVISFIYGMIYVSACLIVGGAFPVFDFVFSIVDVMLWAYFLLVVNSYRRKLLPSSHQ